MKYTLRQPANIFLLAITVFLLLLPLLGPDSAALTEAGSSASAPGLGLFSVQGYSRLTEVAVLIMLYTILALGLNVVVGFTGLLDLGFVAFMTIGAYTTVLLYRLPEWHFTGSFFVVVLIAGAHCALWGLIRGAPTLHLTGDYYAIVTLAFAEIIFLFVLNESWLTGGPSGIKGYPPVTLTYEQGEVQKVKIRLQIEEELDADGRKAQIATFEFTPREIWIGKLAPDAREGLRRRYQRKKPSPDKSGAKIRFRNWDNETAFISMESDSPWLYLGSGMVDGLSPGSIRISHPDEQMPGEYRKPLIFYREELLKPGTHEASVTIRPRFGRRVLRDGDRGFYFLIAGFALITFLIMCLLERSRIARAWFAIKTDLLSAQSCGIHIRRKKMIAFAISGFVGGIGGSLMAFKFLIVSTNIFEFWLSIVVLCCIVLGGMGSIRGVFLGTILFVGLGELLRETYVFENVSEGTRLWVESSGGFIKQILTAKVEGIELNLAKTRYMVFGLLLVLFMIFRPKGILPPTGRSRPLSDDEKEAMKERSSLYHLKTDGED